jgi:hypothetical protein
VISGLAQVDAKVIEQMALLFPKDLVEIEDAAQMPSSRL